MIVRMMLRTVLLVCLALLSVLPDASHGQVPQQRQQQQQQQQKQQQPQQPQRQPERGAVATDQGGAPWGSLSASHQEYLDKVLTYWEHTTSKITRYRSKFKRWEYEPARHVDEQGKVSYKKTLKTYSEGAIKYAAPDKGLFQVEQIQHSVPAKEPGGDSQWVEQKEGHREHWVCDGRSIFEFNYHNSQLIERPLPAEMQGQQITDGPLPFLFGAKVDKIKQRFWVRVVTPTGTKKEYWLEAVPKTKEDAQNFRILHVIISEEDFLPKGMVLFHRNNSKTTFAFEQRETNWNILAQQLNPFMRQFFVPTVPKGWKKVVEPVQYHAAAATIGAAPQIGPRQAQQRRAAPPRRR